MQDPVTLSNLASHTVSIVIIQVVDIDLMINGHDLTVRLTCKCWCDDQTKHGQPQLDCLINVHVLLLLVLGSMVQRAS